MIFTQLVNSQHLLTNGFDSFWVRFDCFVTDDVSEELYLWLTKVPFGSVDSETCRCQFVKNPI